MYAGLLPKFISPTHYAKKILGGGHKSAPSPVEEPTPPIEPGAPSGQIILLGAAALLGVLILTGGRRK